MISGGDDEVVESSLETVQACMSDDDCLTCRRQTTRKLADASNSAWGDESTGS